MAIKKSFNKIAVALGTAAVLSLPMTAFAAKWEFPAIPYGHIHPLPNAAVQPDKNTTYKEIFDVTAGVKNPRKPDPGLVHVARAVNVFASAGIPLNQMKFVAIVHGPATPLVLNDAAYKRKYGVKNPNTPLIEDLAKAGISVQVCGQALADFSFPHAAVNKAVQIDLSAAATIPIYESQGYGYMLE